MEVEMNKIKNLRESQGLRQIDLAMKARVSLSTLWLLEAGYDERASQKIKSKVAAGLGIKVRDVFPEQ